MADDYSSNTGTTGTVEVGGSVTGNIETLGDSDWFAVTLVAGRTYRITQEGSWNGHGTLHAPFLRGMYDSAGVRIAGVEGDTWNSGGFYHENLRPDSLLTFTATETGTHYLAAAAEPKWAGTYKLSVKDLSDRDDFGAWRTGTGAGGTATGRIDFSGDRDLFAIRLEAGRTYRIDLEGVSAGAGTLRDPYLYGIYDADRALIGGTKNNDGGVGLSAREKFTPQETGTYYVMAGAYENAYGNTETGTYTLTVTPLPDDYVASTGTTGRVTLAREAPGAQGVLPAPAGTAAGEIDFRGDHDWFAVTLEAGRTYRIDLEGTLSGSRPASDLRLVLPGVYDAEGVRVARKTGDVGGQGDNSRLYFTAAEAGTHYVAVGATGGGTGTYRLSVADTGVTAAANDHAAGTETTGAVAVGGSATGEIETAGDHDWFAVTLQAGRIYRIDLEGSPTGAGSLSDPYLRGVHDADGRLMGDAGNNGARREGTGDNNSGEGNNSRLNFTARETGTYYVAAGAAGDETGTYTLSVTELGGTEAGGYAAGMATAGAVAVGGLATGEVNFTGDRDWFAVTLEAGRSYRIDLKGFSTGSGSLGNPYLYGIHDADGVLIPGTTDNYSGAGLNSRVKFTAGETGTYYVVAGAAGVGSSGTYALTVTALDDYGASPETTGTVAVGGSAAGGIDHSGDHDWFAVTLEAGRSYRIDLEGTWTGSGASSDRSLVLQGVHDADGVLIPGTTDGDAGRGSNSRVTFVAAESGTYYVAAGARQWTGGTYTLSVTEMGVTEAEDYPAGTDTTGAVAIGGSATGGIDYSGDRDWFAVTLQAGRTYRVDLEGAPTGSGTLSNPFLRGVYDANALRIAGTTDNDDGGAGFNSRLTFTASETGTYYVAAGASGSGTGTYTLSVTDTGVTEVEDFAAGTGTTGAVAVRGSAAGEVEVSGDGDWFAVALQAGRTYRIDLEGSSSGKGTLGNPHLRGVHDADGVLIAGTANDDGGMGFDSRVTFTAAKAGTYYVAAGASGSGTGTYTLSVTDVTEGDDFGAWTGTRGAVAVGGSASGEVEFSDDRDWFAVTLQAGQIYRIDLEGAPNGSGTLINPCLWGVHGADGVLVAGTTNDNGGWSDNSRLMFTAPETGTWYVAAGAAGSGIGTYTLSVTDTGVTAANDHAAGTGTTGAVAVGGSVTGEVDFPEDRDWFAVALQAGKTYWIDLEGAPSGTGTLSDPYLWGVHDADGVLIAGTRNDNGGFGSDSRLKFTASESGTHYVAAGGYWLDTGTYTLSVTELPDDYAASTETLGAVAVGASATGGIDFFGDHDWFAVTLEAGRTYRIDLEGMWTGDGTLGDPYLRGVHDADGVLIAGTTKDHGGAGNNSRLWFTATEAGTYYVAAGGAGDETGTYTLSVTEVSEGDDFEAWTGTTGAVAVGGSATGEIETLGDRDWFAVTLQAGQRYRLDLEGAPSRSGTLNDPYLRGVHDADGALIAGTTNDNAGAGNNSRLWFTAAESGTYYVAAGAARSSTGTYTLSVTDATEGDDFEAWTGTTGAVAVGGSATGGIDYPGDHDWFAVTLQGGRTYRLDLESTWTGPGASSNNSPVLRGIHDADGVRIAGTTDDGGGPGSNSRVTFAAEESGTYYVAAGSWAGGFSGNTAGNYTLSVTEMGVTEVEDYAAGTDTTGAVAVGGTTVGEVEAPGDRDWFAVMLEAGHTYRIDLEGAPNGSGTLGDPHLRGIHDADGVRIAGTTNNNGGEGSNSRVTFTAWEDGTHYVAAGGHGSETGTYTLSVRNISPPDDYAAGTDTTGMVAVGGSATGKVDFSGDRDWFSVTLQAGRTYRIDLEGKWTGDGTLYDTYLRGVRDADGVLIAGTTDNDGGESENSRVEFTAETDGAYYVVAGASESGTGTYTLTVTDVTPSDDFSAGTDTTGTVAVGGSATGKVDFSEDRDWFAVTLQAGRTYRIDMEGSWTGGGTLFNPYLRGVHDADGVLIAGTTDDNGGEGWNSRVELTAEVDGTYYVAAGGWVNREGTYTVSVTDVTVAGNPRSARTESPPGDYAAGTGTSGAVAAGGSAKEESTPDDFGAGTDTTGTVAVGGFAAGEIEVASDRDWYAVTLEAGRTYRIDLEGSGTGDGTLSDPCLYGIHGADGVLVAGTTDDDGGEGSNSQLTFTATTAGTWYVAAGAAGSGTGTYTLSVTDVTPSDDYGAGTGTTGAVSVGSSASGEIEVASDHDWFAVTLQAGRSYRIGVEGAPSGSGTLGDPFLYGIHDTDGVLIADTRNNNGGVGRDSLTVFTASETGIHYVAAGGRASETGTYAVSVTDVTDEDDFGAWTGTSGAVAVGGSATGRVEFARDRDWFAVTLEAGKGYRIDLEGKPTGAGTAKNPYLWGVHDGAGVLIGGTKDNDGGEGRNSRLEFTAEEAGTYYVAAGTAGSSTGTYTLSVEEVM